jgi:peptide/nickel transport system substrate-binding protein
MSHDSERSDLNLPTSEAERLRLSRRLLVGGAAASATGLALGDVQLGSAAGPPLANAPRLQDGGQGIIIGTLGEASTINPFQADESESDWRCKMLFDEFVRPDLETYAATPGIAESWEIDGLSFTFAIQPDATFSDGSDLTADDAKFTLEGFLNPETASPRLVKFAKIAGADEFAAGTADGVSGIEVIDPKTVKITLAEPDAAFLYNMRFLFVVPKALLEGKDLGNASTDPFFQSPVGAGAYVYESWVVGADFVATANPNFWETDKPNLDRFTHRTIADASALVSALESGDIDGSLYAAPTLVGELEENEGLTILVPPFNSPNGTLFNCREAPLDNPQVRRAIAMAVNVPEYVSSSLLGLGDAGLGPIAPDSWAFDETLEPIPFDAEAARTMLQEAGVDNLELSMLCNAGNVLREDWLIRCQADLEQIGVTLNVEFIEWATLVERVTQTRDYQLVGADFAGVTAEPSELFEQFHSSSELNHTGYENADLDELLVKAKETLDQEEAKPIYSEIQQILMQDVPFHWAWYRPFIHVVGSEYNNYTGSNLEGGLFRTLPGMTV